MTTTPDQKAGILRRWKMHREERGLGGDVRAQSEFNWPSLTKVEHDEVMAIYQRRCAMAKNSERPSAPSRLAKHVIYCELGHRRYVETFTGAEEARAFIDLVLEGEKFKWKSERTITAKDGVLMIMCETLEDLMELKKPKIELPEPIPNSVEAFLRGQWPVKNRRASVEGDKSHESNKATTTTATTDEITLAELCSKNKWDARAVRIAMRKAKWKKPEGSWQWSRGSDVEKRLKELMK